MKKEKFYAVKKGRKTGIFTNWNDVKKLVIGFAGAIYKSFSTKEEAESFMKENTISPPSEISAEDTLTAYVDGSYDATKKKYAYACICILPNKSLVKYSGSGNDEDLLKMRNVSGEILAAKYAVTWATDHNYKLLHLYYDYAGIENWATGAWKTNLSQTKDYAEFMKAKKEVIQICFHKVKAHSGDEYNEQVDKLAKEALEK